MEYKRAWDIISSIGQTHVLKYWDSLTHKQKQRFANQIELLDLPTLQLQQQLVNVPVNIPTHKLTAFDEYSNSGNERDQQRGIDLIGMGQVGCLVVAGGQGTRLRIDGPKGICPVSPVKKKTLFQLIAEKTLAAGKRAGRQLPLAIMTSPANHEATVAFFQENNLFGLTHRQLTFFQQGMLPLLDTHGNLFLDSHESFSEGPDGNGSALQQFYKQGLWDRWHYSGVRFVNFILVDNALADPFDAELIGYLDRLQSDVAVKATTRRNAEEKVGVLAKEGNKTVVVEYSELNEQDRTATDDQGNLRFPIANISLFAFTMDFIRSVASAQKPMPLHKAFKAVKHLDNAGRIVKAQEPMSWKFEKFIFDVLPGT